MPQFPSKLAYSLVLAIGVIDCVLLIFRPASVDSIQALIYLLFMAGTLAFILFVRFFFLPRAKDISQLGSARLSKLCHFLSGILFIQISWIVLRLFNHLSMTIKMPYADQMLSSLDQLLGFQWRLYFDFVTSNKVLYDLLDASYFSLSSVSVFGFCALFLIADQKRISFFVETLLVTAIVCTAFGMFFPAKAAVYHYIGGPEMFPKLTDAPGLYHLPHMEKLRSGLPVTLEFANLPGLVTFPSFHTAAGIVLVWSFRGTKLFAPVCVYAVLMVASTPVHGGHYFVDLIAGAFVAVVVLALFQRWESNKDFSSGPRFSSVHASTTATTSRRLGTDYPIRTGQQFR